MSKFELNGRHFITCFDDVTYVFRLNSTSWETNSIFEKITEAKESDFIGDLYQPI